VATSFRVRGMAGVRRAVSGSRCERRRESNILPRAAAPIYGSDRDAGAIEAASSNAERAGVRGDIEWRRAAFSEGRGTGAGGVDRQQSALRCPAQRGKPAAGSFFAKLGQLARERYRHWRVALLAADPRLISRQRAWSLARRSGSGMAGFRSALWCGSRGFRPETLEG
jgi:putative N6-adenine-specific DNA methylase